MSIVASRLARLIALTSVVSSGAACTAIFGLDDKQLEADGGSAHHDAAPSVTDAGHDAAAPCTPDDAGYHDFRTASCWSTYDVSPSLDLTPVYSGGTFDGRYVYFPSSFAGIVLRYDSQGDASFGAESNWSSYSAPSDATYAGALFDGRYAYFIPAGDEVGLFTRYDTTLPFEDSGSWQTYMLNEENPISFIGGVFDGHYLYIAPSYSVDEGSSSGLVVRFDTTRDFTSDSSWTTFDLDTAKQGAQGYAGALFDGRYVYLIPNAAAGVEQTAVVAARFDTTASFGASTSWEFFDLSALPSAARATSFQEGIYDGTSIYFVPTDVNSAVLQYDPTKSFTLPSSWTSFIPSSKDGLVGNGAMARFAVGAFDGRNLYFVPSLPPDTSKNGLVLRWDDPRGSISDSSAWSSFDTNGIKATNFGSAVFDGRYLYLAPGSGIEITFARFDAKETPLQPALPDYFGSFY